MYLEEKMEKKNEIIIFENQKVKLEVNMQDETVWLNREQQSLLCDRDIKTIGKHINNALKEELDYSTVANFATVKKEGNKNMNNEIKTTMNVKDNLINVIRVNNIDYISLTDLARYKNPNNPGDVIIKWMSNKSSFDIYCLWEELFNEYFKLAESREFKNDSANQSFTMSPSRWINMTNAKGFISKRGKYGGGTFWKRFWCHIKAYKKCF